MPKESFTLHVKYCEQIALLTDAQAGILFRAIIAYYAEKDLPKMDEITQIAFVPIRQNIDEEKQKNQMLSLVRKQAGSKGGRPSKSLINKGNKAKKPNAFFAFEKEKLSLLENDEKRSKKEDKVNTLAKEKEKERKKEIYKYNKNNSAGAYVIDFSAMSDEELLEWGENAHTDFADDEAADRFFRWSEEMDKRSKSNAKWKSKVVNTEYGIDRLKSHDEIIKSLVNSSALQNRIKDFLRHCYVNKRVTTNDKLIGIITRLDDAYGENDALKCECVERAISGGYFDVKA